MPATYKRIIVAVISCIAIAAIACALVISGGCSTSAGPLDGAKNVAVNAALDISGIKGRIDSELRDKASELADEVGVPQSVVDNVIDSLAIEEWEATTLPDDVEETGTYAIETEDISATVTTYDDPSIVTVNAYGQKITMEIPKSAQGYVALSKYLDYLR